MSKSKTNFTIWDTDNRTNVPDVLLSRNAKTAKISKIGYRKFDIKGQISKIRHPKFDIKGQISKIGYLKSDMACRKSDMKCRKFDIKGHGHPDKCPGCPISDMGHPGLYIVCPCPKSVSQTAGEQKSRLWSGGLFRPLGVRVVCRIVVFP